MTDPLSITASAIAIGGAIQGVAKCISKLRALREASEVLGALNNEVWRWRALIDQTKDILQQRRDFSQDSKCLSQSSFNSLSSITIVVEERLSRLESIVRSLIRRIDSGGNPEVRKLAWLKKRSKVEVRLHELQMGMMELALVMTMINTQSSIRTQTQLEMYIEQTQAENTNQQKGHEVIMDLPPSDKAAPNEIEGKICDGNVSWLPSHSATVAAPITISIQKHQSTRTVCSGRCQCSCHQPGQCYTPRALNDLIGYLFLGYSGIPWLSSSCDIRSCAHVYQNFSMQFRWILPSWVGSRMIAATIFSSTKYGPEFHLRIPAVRPRTDPIFSLVMQGDIEGIQSEFRKGSASPFDVDEAGYSLVWFALSAFNHRILETCQFLLHEGADPLDEESRDPKRLWTTFDCAWILILGKQVSLSAALGLRIIFDNSDRLINPRFPLLHEIVLGFVNLDLLAYLDTFTGDIDQTDAYGRTALEWAVARNDVAAVRAFLDRGADSSRGSWALSHSISGPASDRATIESLTRFKQDIGTSDRRDDTMLIEACQHNNPEAIRALLSLGADINARNNYGFTALHYAAYWNRHECLAVLLESHADCSLQTNNGHNILYITMTSGDIRTLEIIGKAPTLFRSEMVVCPKFTFEDIRQFRDQIRENSLGKEWWEAWKRLLGRFSGAAVEDSGVLEPERGHDEQNSWNEISYSEDEDGGIFVDAVERLEAVEA